MCTGLIAAMTSGVRARWFFHGGRAVSYTSLGALAGMLGAQMPKLPIPLATASLILFSSALLVLGLKAFNTIHLAWPEPLGRRFTAFYARVVKPGSKGFWVPFLGGLFLPLLPCGWLYAFVLGAASTGSVVYGAVSMGVFFLGTLPALEAGASMLTGGVITGVLRPLTGRLPWLPGLILVAAGFLSLFLKFF
jgi:sulfite exporter TauE/SafE